MNKKTNRQCSGLFLRMNDDQNEKMREYTISGNKKDGAYLSNQVREFISCDKSALYVSSAVEEMIVHIVDMNDDLEWIDVIIRYNGEYTVISMKYSGIGYNTNDDSNFNCENTGILSSISDSIDNSQILGLNNTVMTIKM